MSKRAEDMSITEKIIGLIILILIFAAIAFFIVKKLGVMFKF